MGQVFIFDIAGNVHQIQQASSYLSNNQHIIKARLKT